MKIVNLDNKDVAKIFLPYRNIDKIDISQIKPYREVSGSMKDMETFLKKHHNSGQMVGFEMNYENETTTFNLITDRYKHEQTERRFDSFHSDDGEFAVNETDFIDVEDNEYMTVYDFSFNSDYWHPLPYFDEIEGRDPIDEILTEMAGKDHNLKFKYQVIAQPIQKSRWSHRYPLPWMAKGMMKDVYKIGEDLGRSLTYITKATLSISDTIREPFGDLLNKSLQSFKNAVWRTVNFPRKWISGLDYETYKNEFVGEGELLHKVESKIEQQGYITQIRLICVGEDENNVNQYAPEVAKRIEQSFTYTSVEQDISQGLRATQKNNEDWLMTQAARMVDRESGIDFNKRFSDKENLYYFKKNRRDPTILTPKELAGLMHYLEGSEHPSIEWANR